MAGIEIRKNREYWAPAWAKEANMNLHLLPGGAKLDPSAYDRDESQVVTTAGTAARNEVQTVTISGTPTGGTFTLTYKGQTTAPIAYNAANTAVQAALRALENVPDGTGIAVTGSGPYVATFSGEMGNRPQPVMSANGSGLTGGTNPSVAVAQTTAGLTGATTLGATTLQTVATEAFLKAGTQLRFGTGSGQSAYVRLDTIAGATSVPVFALQYEIPIGSEAYVPGTGRAFIASGTPVGCTTAEYNAGAPFGPAADSDDMVYLLYHPVDNVLANNDIDLYRHGRLVDIAHLPGYAALSTALKAKIAANYEIMRGID